MSPSEAAAVIGCTTNQVRYLIRTKKLKARKKPTADNQHGYVYEVDARSVKSYANKPQGKGYPRGQARL